MICEGLLAVPQPIQRVARRAELRQCPGGADERVGKGEADVPRPEHGDPMLQQ